MKLRELNRLVETLDGRIQDTLKGIPAFLLNGQEDKAKQESEKYLKLRALKEELTSINFDSETIQRIKIEMF